MRYLFIVSIGACMLFGDTLSHTSSMQGYTGIINTPNAQVMNEGDITFHYNNQFDSHLSEYDYNAINSGDDTFVFGVGLFPYFEIQGRLSEAPGYHRDLSANVKFQLPFKHKYLPNIAIGVQDLGGDASHYNNTYIVLDKELWFLRASLGYGRSHNDNENLIRMDGLFGGVEIKTFDWLYLLAEDDSREKHIGVRLEMPNDWSSFFKANALISANVENDYDTSIAFNLTFPLYEKRSSEYYALNENVSNIRTEATVAQQAAVVNTSKHISKDARINISNNHTSMDMDEIEKKLVNIGLENIEIATKNTQLYLSYENNVFLHNELDALGVVMGLLVQAPLTYDTFVIEPKKSKTVITSIRGDLNAARAYYEDQNTDSHHKLSKSLSMGSPLKDADIGLKSNLANDSFLRPRLEISPIIQTFVGTDIAAFDYMLWLRGNLYMSLYKGIDFSIVGDLALSHSDNLDPDNGVFRYAYNDSHIESVMLHNTDNILGSINTLSVGIFEENFAGLIDQWIYNYENHTFKMKLGYFEQFQDGNPYQEFFQGKIEKRELYLAKYSYLFEEYDLLGEVRAGQYWNQDRGFDVNAKRYFGDVAVSLVYKYNDNNSGLLSEQRNHYVGIGIELPLTPKHTPIYKYGQIKGTNAFSYTQSTTIKRDDGTNTIIIGGGLDPKVAFESENYFLNRNRLQLGYIQQHLIDLPNAFDDYIGKF